MPRRNLIINKEQLTSLRRSPRLQLHKNRLELQDPHYSEPKPRSNIVHPSSISKSEAPYSTPNASVKKTHKDYPENNRKKMNKSNGGSKNCGKFIAGPRKSPRLNNRVEGFCKSNDGSRNCTKLSSGLRKSRRLNIKVEEFSCLRRSPRFCNGRNTDKHVEKTGDEKSNKFRGKKVLLAKAGVDSCDTVEGKRERRLRISSVAFVAKGGERKERNIDNGTKVIGVKRKRKRKRKIGQETEGLVHGWTKEQEVALQRAYFAAKPTPHFWKKVSKLVPGKSAQDCFDKIHSDHLTPPQPRPRSRANKANFSPLGNFSLSANELLEPTEPKIKRPNCNKRKSHLAQKIARQLLQKHYNVDRDYEADLFSDLEPTVNPSTQAFQQDEILSTPERVPVKLRSLQKCRNISSSGHKKPLSSFVSICGMPLVSPPVLKQVKNRAVHEKYIDQLHCREAKRKAASALSAKSVPGHESRIHVQKFDVLRAAKNALVSDAKDVINQFRHLQADPMSNSSDFDDCGVDINDDDDEGEDEP